MLWSPATKSAGYAHATGRSQINELVLARTSSAPLLRHIAFVLDTGDVFDGQLIKLTSKVLHKIHIEINEYFMRNNMLV